MLKNNKFIITSDDYISLIDSNFKKILSTINTSSKITSITPILGTIANKFAVSSEDKFITIFVEENDQIKKLSVINTLHRSYINKIIELPLNKLADCSNDLTIKIWDLQNNSLFHKYEGHTGEVITIMGLEYNEDKESYPFLSIGTEKNMLFWDLKEKKAKSKLKDIECFDSNSITKLENGKILVGGKNKITIISFKDNKPIKELFVSDDEPFGGVTCFMVYDSNSVVCGCIPNNHNGIICHIDLINKSTYYKKEIEFNQPITYIVKIDAKNFACCGNNENTFKIFKK